LKLNSRDIAKAEIDMKLKKYELILEVLGIFLFSNLKFWKKIKKATQKNEANNLPVKNLNFLNEYVYFA